jgi:hypothetical protein
MTRIEVNVLTGEQVEIELTPAEVAAANAAHLAWEQRPNQYRTSRAAAYPPIGDQLDDLFRQGAFSPEMAAALQAVKTAHPKGR